MITQELYHAVPIAANATYNAPDGKGIGGFICVTAGTITVTRQQRDATVAGTPVVTAFPVSAGQVYRLAFSIPHGYVVTLAGGASGTLLTA